MKYLKIITPLLITLMMATGCDFFRSMLGKPTSKDIEKMKIAAEAEQKRLEQERLKAQQEALSLAEAQKKLAEEQAQKEAALPKERYYLIYGSFKVESNADRMYKKFQAEGLNPSRIKFRNGFELVAVKAFDDLHEAYNEMGKWIEKEYTPEDIWVYDTLQNLHVR